jgi:hypothetical protein
MKNFKEFIQEQKQAEDETTLSPNFLEKKEKHDRLVDVRIEKPTEEISKKAKSEAVKETEGKF